MQKVIVVLMTFLLGMGLTQPCGFMQSRNLSEMYAHCSIEDHDITPLDFVFEHLLNLESIVNLIEGEHTYPPGDHAHDPVQAAQVTAVVISVLPATDQFDIQAKPFNFFERNVYSTSNAGFATSDFHADILRPPIAA